MASARGLDWVDLGEGGVWRLMTRVPGATFDRAESSTQIHAAVQNLERTFGDRPVVTAMRAQLDALQQREKLRHNRYLLR